MISVRLPTAGIAAPSCGPLTTGSPPELRFRDGGGETSSRKETHRGVGVGGRASLNMRGARLRPPS